MSETRVSIKTNEDGSEVFEIKNNDEVIGYETVFPTE
jgi:hypothetical protein